jgi:hypothetical protein
LPFYKRFGFFPMLSGQMQTYEMDWGVAWLLK